MRKNSQSGCSMLFRKNSDFAAKEIIGQRSNQEDYSLFRLIDNSASLLAVLSDGMGGHSSGEIASKMAVDSFEKIFNEYPSDSVPIKLGAALQQANSELAKSVHLRPDLEGMGCTLVGVYIGKRGLQWISVGDSPLFLFRDNKLIRLNADHSMAPLISESLKQGKITKEEAANHPNRHALRSAVMGEDLPLIDAPNSPIPVFKGDVIIVASDGLLTLSDKEIESIIFNGIGKPAETIAQLLISAVELKRHPRQDNTSVQVVVIPSSLGYSKLPIKKIFFYFISFIFVLFASLASYLWLASDSSQTQFFTTWFNNTGEESPKPIKLPQAEGLTQPQPQGLEAPKSSTQEVPPTSPVKPSNEKGKTTEPQATKTKKAQAPLGKKTSDELKSGSSGEIEPSPKSAAPTPITPVSATPTPNTPIPALPMDASEGKTQ